MKKVVCFGLCFLIVLSSFVLCFADGGSPIFLPVASPDDLNVGVAVDFSNRTIYYRGNVPNIYLVFYNNGSTYNFLYFSPDSSAVVYSNNNLTTSVTSSPLVSEYNGYYFSSNISGEPASSYVLDGIFSSPTAVIDFIDKNNFSTSFDLGVLINGSVSWLSSMAQAVKNNGLLLFFVLTVFVGVGIGLFNRFRRD